eukprot:scaffold132912_cov20-Tisochrysis_lutea.AAC.3
MVLPHSHAGSLLDCLVLSFVAVFMGRIRTPLASPCVCDCIPLVSCCNGEQHPRLPHCLLASCGTHTPADAACPAHASIACVCARHGEEKGLKLSMKGSKMMEGLQVAYMCVQDMVRGRGGGSGRGANGTRIYARYGAWKGSTIEISRWRNAFLSTLGHLLSISDAVPNGAILDYMFS